MSCVVESLFQPMMTISDNTEPTAEEEEGAQLHGIGITRPIRLVHHPNKWVVKCKIDSNLDRLMEHSRYRDRESAHPSAAN